MSSNSRLNTKVPPSISLPICSSPERIASPSDLEIMPVVISIRAWARDPARSSFASRLSKSMEALISSMMAEGPAPKRPPHILFALICSGAHLSRIDMTRSRLLIVLAALVALVAGALVVLYVIPPGNGTPKQPASLAALKPAKAPGLAPNVSFTDMGGRGYALSKYRGRYVLLNLWASWCGPCVKELPALANLQRTIPASRLAVVTVDVE